MRNVRPTLVAVQPLARELIVQFAYPISGPLYLDEHGRSRRQECFHVSQLDVEGDDMAANLLQKFQCGRFRSDQLPRRKNREMSLHVINGWVEFLAQLGDEFANWIPDVRHHCVA